MNCPKCQSCDYIKNGIVKNIQRYKCRKCGFNYSVDFKSTAYPGTTKRIALILYLEGEKISTIARLLEVSHVSVSNWIKKYGNNLEELRVKHNMKFEDEE